MALQIGFAGQYYTLWDVTSEDVYTTVNDKHFKSGVNHRFTYIQNLSMNEESAIEKAKSKGCKSLTVDDELKGQSQSFTKNERFEYKYEDYEFSYGKYQCMDIRECTDAKYLLWFYNDSSNKFCAERLVEIDDNYSIVGGDLLSKTEIENRKIWKLIRSGKKILKAVSNFKDEYEGYEFSVKVSFEPETDAEQVFLDEYPYGVPVRFEAKDIEELELKSRFYNGYTFYVPSGMRSFKKREFKTLNNKIELV